jgi:hypothetical protein
MKRGGKKTYTTQQKKTTQTGRFEARKPVQKMLSSGDFYTIFARIFSSFFHVSLFVFLPFVSAALKFRYYEKATKFEKVGNFFKFLWPFQKS